MRRKGERKLERTWPDWGPGHPIIRSINSGSPWFYAWLAQACTPMAVIERKTGIPQARQHDFDHGRALPTAEEIAALAVLWRCPAEDIRASIEMGLAAPLTAHKGGAN